MEEGSRRGGKQGTREARVHTGGVRPCRCVSARSVSARILTRLCHGSGGGSTQPEAVGVGERLMGRREREWSGEEGEKGSASHKRSSRGRDRTIATRRNLTTIITHPFHKLRKREELTMFRPLFPQELSTTTLRAQDPHETEFLSSTLQKTARQPAAYHNNTEENIRICCEERNCAHAPL